MGRVKLTQTEIDILEESYVERCEVEKIDPTVEGFRKFVVEAAADGVSKGLLKEEFKVTAEKYGKKLAYMLEHSQSYDPDILKRHSNEFVYGLMEDIIAQVREDRSEYDAMHH